MKRLREQVNQQLNRERELQQAGWIQNDRGWWHPPSCVASWPFHEAWEMYRKDQQRAQGP